MKVSTLSCLFLAITATATFSAHGAVHSTQTFTGEYSESFENASQNWQYTLTDLFSSHATATAVIENNIQPSNRWFYNSFITPNSGSALLGVGHGGVSLKFTQSVQLFGGYFSSVTNVENGIIEFLNNNNLIASSTILMPLGAAMTWNGWLSDNAFDQVVIHSNFGSGTSNYGGWFALDDLQVSVSPVPEPQTYLLTLVGLAIVGLFIRSSP